MTHDFGLHARRELLESTSWYLADGGEPVAELFEVAVQRALRLLEFMPRLGRTSYPGVRTWPLRDFPYTLVCRVKGGGINLIAGALKATARTGAASSAGRLTPRPCEWPHTPLRATPPP